MKAELFRKIGNTTNYRDDICRKRNSELGEHHKANETVVCPSRWMVIPQLYLIGIVWSATFIFLILLTFLNLTKNRLFFKAVSYHKTANDIQPNKFIFTLFKIL